MSKLLYFTFEFGVFGYERFVDQIQLRLHWDLYVFEDVLDLGFEYGEIVLHFALFLLYFLFEIVYVLLFVSQ